MGDCECVLDFAEPDGEPSWHYTRTCPVCATAWGALHCEHDGVQNPCPGCGWIGPGKRTPAQSLGLTEIREPAVGAGVAGQQDNKEKQSQ